MNVDLHAARGNSRNILSLCSGVGGLELGIHLALNALGEAGRGICHVEIEAGAAASLVASMESGWLDQAPIWSDMRTFDPDPWRGFVDILASGDPCQDNSVAGKGAGKDGKRFLAPEVVRIAKGCRPHIIFRENVPGNLDGQIEAIVPPLEELGYRVAAGIFSSSETGNTMRRERLFIMAECADFGHERGRPTWGWRAGPENGCIGVDGAQRAERGAIDGPCGASGRNIVSRREKGPIGIGKPSETLARPQSERRGEAGRDSKRPAQRTSGEGRELGRPSSTEPQGQQRRQHDQSGRQVKRGYPLVSSRAILPPTIIPGPTDSRWIDVLDRWPEYQPALSQEEAQSYLRRGIDAMAHRVERLRATGNGVDPMVAAYAFLSLGALLAETR